jgi:hypothetical protein
LNSSSGLAGVLFEKPESSAGDTDDISVPKLLADAERLDFSRSSLVGCFYDLQYRVLHLLRNNKIANFWIVFGRFCHQHSMGRYVAQRNTNAGLWISNCTTTHFRFHVLKTTRLNDNGELFAASTPAVIRKPEPALDAQKRRYLQHHRMIPHKPSPRLR